MVGNKKKLNILLIGHLSTRISGSSLSFKQLVDILANNDQVDIQVINAARPAKFTSSWLVNFAVALRITAEVLLSMNRIDVVTFHASRPAMMSYGPILFFLTRLFCKPLVLRLFGGALEQEYRVLSPVKKWIFDKTLLHSELFLLQTKYLIEFFERLGTKNTRWYPTSRKMIELPSHHTTAMSRCRHYIFLGRVVEEKGIGVLLQAAQYFRPEITVDIFGPLDGHYTAESIYSETKGKVCYRGALMHEQVQEKLLAYDALILPTFYPGEGYPGVILEAYSAGLPVIATNWRAISEIVNESVGILIPPHSDLDLAEAMNRLYSDVELYRCLRDGALAMRVHFSDEFWANRFVEWCVALVAGNINKADSPPKIC